MVTRLLDFLGGQLGYLAALTVLQQLQVLAIELVVEPGAVVFVSQEAVRPT